MTVIGAAIAPSLPTIEQEFMVKFRKLVGHCSAVYKYKMLNPHIDAAFPNINIKRVSVEYAAGIHAIALAKIDIFH